MKRLPEIVQAMNHQTTRLIGMSHQVETKLSHSDRPTLYFVEGKKHSYLPSQLQVVKRTPEAPPPAPPPKPVKKPQPALTVWATSRGRFVRQPGKLRQ